MKELMDHRCLYGHRVPTAFTFAIQNRSCPTCGAPTVTVNGYQAARKLATEAGLDAVAAFHALRVIEADWVLAPASQSASAATPTPGAALAAPEAAARAETPPVESAAPSPEEDVVVVEDAAEGSTGPALAPPPPPARAVVPSEPRISARVKPDKRAEPAAEPPPRPAVTASPAFGAEEEDFFKGA